MTTLANRIVHFNQCLDFKGTLPKGINLLNPYKESEVIRTIVRAFYSKYYNDDQLRHMILGINPGRLGAGFTGIPFTDTRRLQEKCSIEYSGRETHEPSSVFIYEMIDTFGGAETFYQQFYIGSVCPLGFTSMGKNGREVNYNYYDSRELTMSVEGFIIENIRKQINMGMSTDICYCFGTGKNEAYLRRLNEREKFFKKIIALEHPRFIMQYKSRLKQAYIQKYLEAFSQATSVSG
ncbi:MAG TPA: DUF4918 domain-containing protein [Bacteroidales bacterium]|nr:MAG: DUF4918 domain-containing protein [Bacteroidetes bacterium GWE2_42_24]OFY28225.1 MAG: DUF4918 domain-containing protein [Bacteroidetes bacterium GWF2_43_11]HAQ64930.1 DUF4918 domain-containing protein [Bacteroidales bacterium]HBZ65673.1 DUF4918 domain-containing protein [Bacteroidales bacterium]